MRLLVAGGAGFIGSHLCEALVGVGHDVVAVDNLITGRTDNLAELESSPRFRFIEQDIVDPLDVECDAIFHLASPASPVGYMSHPIETQLTNSLGTHRLLELARRRRARFLLTSTSEIYGDPQVHPQSETYWGNVNPIGPRSCYDESKRFAESLTMEYVRQHGLDARIVRIFNTYGPRNDLDDGRVVPNFITQALRGEPITVYGSGLQTRSFCYVSDMVDALQAVMFADGLAGEVFNLGNPDERSILEFAAVIMDIVGLEVQIVYQPLPVDDPARRCPNINKVRSRLGWEPRVSLQEGLEHTVVWFEAEQRRRAALRT